MIGSAGNNKLKSTELTTCTSQYKRKYIFKFRLQAIV